MSVHAFTFGGEMSSCEKKVDNEVFGLKNATPHTK